jgi:tight adherence protein C
MTAQLWFVAALVGGAVTGAAGFGIVWVLMPAAPSTRRTLRRLHPALIAPGDGGLGELARGRIRLPAADLNILGRTEQRHLIAVGGSAAAGFALPVLVALLAAVAGVTAPITVPAVFSVLLAAALAALVHADMRYKAKRARKEFCRCLRSYVRLTATQVRAGHGVVEAMEDAAAIGSGWAFARMRTALLTAQLNRSTPWAELLALANAIDVIELANFADVMRSAGSDGVQIYKTLRAQAASLSEQQRVRHLETIKTRTAHLDIPTTLLVVILLALPGYPLMLTVFNA